MHGTASSRGTGGAEELFGVKAAQALGKPCFEVVRGRDWFRNRFCSESCPVRHMARRGEPIHSFTLLVARAAGDICAKCCIILVPQPCSSRRAFFHLMQAEPAREAHAGTPIATDPDHELPIRPPADPRDAPVRRSSSRGLSSREVAVVRMLAGGLVTAEIGRTLGVSTVTVRNHIQHILGKLDAHSRLQAILIAKRDNLT